ncbi:hypothetical protein SEA_ALLEB_57 [Microbacterium phage Alleb]|nr:hypothetical protein SEA_ALLEB_57 [Microbacterium phage Alleb]
MAVSKYADQKFWVDTADRAVATFAQSLAGALGIDQTGILDLDWSQSLSIACAITLASVLTSVAFRGRGETT